VALRSGLDPDRRFTKNEFVDQHQRIWIRKRRRIDFTCAWTSRGRCKLGLIDVSVVGNHCDDRATVAFKPLRANGRAWHFHIAGRHLFESSFHACGTQEDCYTLYLRRPHAWTVPAQPKTEVNRFSYVEATSGVNVSEQEERIARNEALFREVNERIAESAQRFESDRAEFVCECAAQDCTERVEATLDEYEHARADGTRFLMRPGHVDTTFERVLERRGSRLAIVQKVNVAIARMVRKLDPRAEAA
jgi:hypothetical protein